MTKKYILKPGKHQFAPGEPAIHDNNSLTDKQARWYLKAYPHIQSLFASLPKSILKNQPVKSPTISEIQINEDLPTTN
ncbi:MAG: hypothetical protein V4619_00290 [Bacteroidota bacterium]